MTHRTDGKFPVVLGTQKMTIFQRAGQSRTITELQNLEMQPSLGLQPQKKKVFLQDPAVSCPSNLAGGGALLGCGVRAVHIVVHHRPHGVVRLPCLLRRLGGHRGWEGCKGGNAIPRPGGKPANGRYGRNAGKNSRRQKLGEKILRGKCMGKLGRFPTIFISCHVCPDCTHQAGDIL